MFVDKNGCEKMPAVEICTNRDQNSDHLQFTFFKTCHGEKK